MKGDDTMGELLLFLLKGFGIFLGICVAIILISIAIGTLELTFGAGSRKPKKKQQKEED